MAVVLFGGGVLTLSDQWRRVAKRLGAKLTARTADVVDARHHCSAVCLCISGVSRFVSQVARRLHLTSAAGLESNMEAASKNNTLPGGNEDL